MFVKINTARRLLQLKMEGMMNVEPTAEVIDDMAQAALYRANELQQIAKKMRERNDISYASEAISTARNLLGDMRLDLLITRPLREVEKFKGEE